VYATDTKRFSIAARIGFAESHAEFCSKGFTSVMFTCSKYQKLKD